MKVFAIQSYGMNSVPNVKRNNKIKEYLQQPYQAMQNDTVSFKGKASVGATIGGILGAAAITLISGGAAIPLVVGAYTLGGAAIGAGFGEALGDDKNSGENKNDK